MTIITTSLHYPDGIYNSTRTPTSYNTSGYEPSHGDVLMYAHIVTDASYEAHIDRYSLVLNYKYIRLEATRFMIGRTAYPIQCIDTYKGSELKHLLMLRDMRDELLISSSINGLPIEYRLVRVLSHMEIQ